MMRTICLNSDLGEVSGPEGRMLDAAILRVVTRCNVACGGHAGDEISMRETVQRGNKLGVRIGAHPSYPDRRNFGRMSLEMGPAQLSASLDRQVTALIRIAHGEGVAVTHLKPHGALYNDAARNPALAEVIVQTAKRAGLPELIGPPHSALEQSAREAGLLFIAEGFADRAYERDGALTPRSTPGAVIADDHAVVQADRKSVV